jgi:hypothetical protein
LPAFAICNEHRGAAVNGPGISIKIKYLRQTTSGAAGNGLGTTAKYPATYNDRCAAGNGLGAKIKYLQRTTSGAAGYGLGTTTKYLCSAASIGLGTAIKYLRRATSAQLARNARAYTSARGIGFCAIGFIFGRAGTAGIRFARDDKELGLQLGEAIAPRTAS